MIFRNDDINQNSNFEDIEKMYSIILRYFPGAMIVSGVNILSQKSEDGNSYAAIKPVDIDFASVSQIVNLEKVESLFLYGPIASHGLAHLDHRAISRDLQEFSIRSSCNILDSKIFIPPFLRYNKTTFEICKKNNIQVLGVEDGEWTSLDNGPVDPKKQLFVFHSWKHTPESFEKKFEKLSTDLFTD